MREADELTEAERRFEEALQSLRPAPARIDAVGAAAEARHRMVRRRRWQAAAAVVVLAAGGAWLAVESRQPGPEGGPRDAVVEAATPAEEPPTLLTYRLALGRSTAELDALLDQHVSESRASDSSFTLVGVLAL